MKHTPENQTLTLRQCKCGAVYWSDTCPICPPDSDQRVQEVEKVLREVQKIIDRCEGWHTSDDLGAQFAIGRMDAFRDCARWLRKALGEEKR